MIEIDQNMTKSHFEYTTYSADVARSWRKMLDRDLESGAINDLF